jgi:hypothetical protein
MAAISVLGVCSGGDHVRLRVTLAGGRQVDRQVSLRDLRAGVEDVSLEEFIIRQVASLVRGNPDDTPQQRRARIESFTYME